MPNKLLCCLALGAAITCASSAFADSPNVIDQRDPKFQAAMEHLSNAADALSLAQAELQKAGASHPLPGLDVDRMSGALVPVEETLQVLLSPERKRLQHRTAVPDGAFFIPTPLGE